MGLIHFQSNIYHKAWLIVCMSKCLTLISWRTLGMLLLNFSLLLFPQLLN